MSTTRMKRLDALAKGKRLSEQTSKQQRKKERRREERGTVRSSARWLVVTVGCVRAAHGSKSQPLAQCTGPHRTKKSRVHQVTNRSSVLTCLARNKQRPGRPSQANREMVPAKESSFGYSSASTSGRRRSQSAVPLSQSASDKKGSS